ncbi:MAG: hypothetical protein IT364_08080 [Candidatus Hydrogenedentes bacterium]|nr:hypothetical protein [Candidatus Hydrogenedentota bacterium]
MQWILLTLLVLTLGTIGAIAAWAPNRHFLLRVAGVILVTTLAAVAVSMFWKQSVLALAIAAVCGLAIAVMFQKVAPGKAIVGALTAFVLLFAFSWLALKLADIFLFNKEVDLSRWIEWIGELPGSSTSWDSFPMPVPELFVAFGLALLLSSALLPRTARAVAVLAGLFLLFVFGARILATREVYLGEATLMDDPLVRLALGCLALFAILRLLLSIGTGNQNKRG